MKKIDEHNFLETSVGCTNVGMRVHRGVLMALLIGTVVLRRKTCDK